MYRAGLRESNGPTDLTVGAVQDGACLTRVGSQIIGQARGRLIELSADFTVVSATLADVTGLSFDLNGSTTYWYCFDFVVNQATNPSTQGYGVNYSGSLTRISYQASFGTGTGATITNLGANVNNTALVGAATQTAATTLGVRVAGSIRTSSGGTLTLRAQRSAVTTTIRAGAIGVLNET